MLLVSMVFLFPLSIYSQNQIYKIDSAINVVNTQANLSNIELLKTYRFISEVTSDNQQKIKYSKKLIQLAEELGNDAELIYGYSSLGYANKLLGELQQALNYYLKAAKIANKLNDDISEADIYTNLASLYTSNENFSNSLEYYKKALRLYENKADSQRLAITYTNYGYAMYKSQLFDSAIQILNDAVIYARASHWDIVKAYALANLSLALAKTDDFSEATNQLNEAMKIMRENEDYYGLSDCLIEIGSIYLEKGLTTKAKETLEQGYEYASKNGFTEQIQNASKYLAQAYKEQGNIEKAFEYQSRYYTYRDSLINAEQIRKLADLRTEYEVGQKQVEVDLLTAEKRTQQIIIFAVTGGAILVIVLLGMVYKNYRDKNRINKILEDQKRQLEELNSTKDKFFSIISHDLRGPVSAFAGISRLIKYSVQSKNTEELTEIADHIDQTVDHLSSLLDNLLNWAMQQQGHFPHVPEKLDLNELTGEIKGIFSTMAQGKNITLSTAISEDIQLWADKNTTMTILRNLVNNALKFTKEGGTVTISAQEKEDMAEIKVSDTGVGMSKNKLNKLFKMEGKKSDFGTAGEKGLGLGLQLVYEFVEMNKGTIEVESEEGKGTTFIITLPLFDAVNQETEVIPSK